MICHASPRLIILSALLLTAEVLRINGREIEDEPGSYAAPALTGRDALPNSHRQVYGLYLEPASVERRSRLFVGKRLRPDLQLEDGEDYIVLSSDGGTPLIGEESKRNHLFVGKRGTPRFVGKRSVARLLQRDKRSAYNEANELEYGRGGKEPFTETENEDMWMGEEEDGSDAMKRSRMFVGKRRESEENKRSRLFVGRRGGQVPENAAAYQMGSDSEGVFPGGEALEADKRSRLFVGKRPTFEHDHKSHWEDHKAAAEKINNVQSTDASQEPDADKRSRLFPGKRPAPGFVGKREASK